MAKHEGYFFWGAVLGAATAAIAGCVMLVRSFRSSPAGGAPRPGAVKGRSKTPPARVKAGGRRPVRRPAAKK